MRRGAKALRRLKPALLFVTSLWAQDAREILRKSVELDQANWMRMKDYTWVAQSRENRLDGRGNAKSEETRKWETVILYGEPHRKMLEKDGKPLPPDEQRKEKEKLDKAVAKLEQEAPAQRDRRLADYEKSRAKDREFLREVPAIFDAKLEGEQKIDGRDVWVIALTPRPGYRPKSRDAKDLQKIRGKLWVDKAEYQWVRIEAETTDTISFGVFLARLNPGAKLVFEQTRVNGELWLPKRMLSRGTGRLGLVKKISMEEEVTWSNYRKFQVESKIVSEP